MTDEVAAPAAIEGQLALEVGDVDVDTSVESSGAALVQPIPLIGERPPALRRVWLQRFKSFEEFSVELGRFNVLVGANNSGKSTLLQAIDLLYSLLKLHAEEDHLASQGKYLPASVLPVASMKDLFSRRVTRHANTNVPVVIGAEFADGSKVEFGIRHLFGSMNSRVQESVGMEGQRFLALLSHPAVWVPSAVGIVRDEEYRTQARRTALINAGRHNEVLRNLLLQLSQERPESYKRLLEILSERFGATLDAVAFDDARDEYVRADLAAAGDVQHDLYSAGSGFVQVVQLLAFVLSESPSVVLLDEPDAHLHSSLQRAIVEILEEVGRDQEFQIIIATHSKEIINFIDPSRLVFLQPGTTEAAPMSDEVTPISVLRSLGAIDNVDAFSLVRNRRCLFVEGTSDSLILGRFATTLGLRTFTGDDRVIVIPTGGADQFGHVQQLDVFEQLLGHPIASVEVRDRDGRTDADRENLIDKAPRPLTILERDSIESYLLEPAVIARVINEARQERSKEPTATRDDIEQRLMAITDELKVTTYDRVANRYFEYARRLGNGLPSVQEVNEIARAFVDEQWESFEQRLLVVSGKKTLASLRASVQEAYGVNFGNERLAEAFMAEEVPAQLSAILHEISALQAP